MSDDRVTCVDLRKRLGIEDIETIIKTRQLRFLGHQVRLSEDRVDRRILWGIFPEQGEARRSGSARTTTRQHYWTIVQEVMGMTAIPTNKWQEKWEVVAKDRLRWQKLVNKWRKARAKLGDEGLWERKHEEGSMDSFLMQQAWRTVRSAATSFQTKVCEDT